MNDSGSCDEFSFPRKKLFDALRATTGRYYEPYRSKPFATALRHRLQKRDQPPDTYLRWLRQSPQEARHLERQALIGMTSFFRSHGAFDALAEQLKSYLSRPRTPRRDLRVWVPACSTGQEAYSLAILLAGLLPEIDGDIDFRILATDICAAAIEHARTGYYEPRALDSLPGQMESDYFLNRCVIDGLRRRLSFEVHDLFDAAPVDTVDLISCRNLLIYLRPDHQTNILESLADHLVPQGLLFVGASENIPSENEYFSLLDRNHRVFCRTP